MAALDSEEKPSENILNDGDRRRDEERGGSKMVKRQKSFPELKKIMPIT